MSAPPDDPTIADLDTPPPVPSAAELRAAVRLVIAALDAGAHAAPYVIPPATAAVVGSRLAGLPAVLSYIHRGGPLPPVGWGG